MAQYAIAVPLAAAVAVAVPLVLWQRPIAGAGDWAQTQSQGKTWQGGRSCEAAISGQGTPRQGRVAAV